MFNAVLEWLKFVEIFLFRYNEFDTIKQEISQKFENRRQGRMSKTVTIISFANVKEKSYVATKERI